VTAADTGIATEEITRWHLERIAAGVESM